MAITDQKITAAEKSQYNVKSIQGSRLKGTVSENKNVFDKLVEFFIGRYNALIDEISGGTFGAQIKADYEGSTSVLNDILSKIEEEILLRYTSAETDTLVTETTNPLVNGFDVNLTTGVITVTFKDGTVKTWDTPIEKVPAKFEFVEEDGSYYLKVTNEDGSSTKTNVTSLMNIYGFDSSGTIVMNTSTAGTTTTVTATIKDASIEKKHMSLSLTTQFEEWVTQASNSASEAANSEKNAATYAANAETSAENAATSERNAANSASAAATSEVNAKTSETNAANSEAKVKTSETNAATSEKNAATYAANAKTSEGNAASSATKAATSETNAASSATAAATSAETAKAATDSKMDKTNPVGTGSFAMNMKDGATLGEDAHVEGFYGTASGKYAHSEGYYNYAVGEGAHAEGGQSWANGLYSHAECSRTTANGKGSHSEGYDTYANGNYSHSEGYYTSATGNYSHVEGNGAKANGKDSHAEGLYTIASGEEQHAQGRANVEDTEGKYAHIVGNGYWDTTAGEYHRSNAHTLDWSGNAWFAGTVKMAEPTAEDDATTKKYVDETALGGLRFSLTADGLLHIEETEV